MNNYTNWDALQTCNTAELKINITKIQFTTNLYLQLKLVSRFISFYYFLLATADSKWGVLCSALQTPRL